jgi:hypothetical protein
VIELSRPIWVLRSPGSSEPRDQVDGQNTDRETMMQSCPNNSAGKVRAKANTAPPSPSITHETSASRLPPMRSVQAPPIMLNTICAITGEETSVPISTPEYPRW